MQTSEILQRFRHPTLPWMLLLAWNLPIIAAWLIITHPASYVYGSVPALYILLILGILGMIVLPVFLGDIRQKPWLLITLVGVINIYWSLIWITTFVEYAPDPPYDVYRIRIMGGMILTSIVTALIYSGVAGFMRRRR